MLEVFNYIHIIYILLSISCTIILYFLLRKYPQDKQKKFLIILAFIGFALHFLKQLFYWNIDKLCESTLENICAVSSVILPFALLNNKKSILFDFLFFAGIVGGLGAIFYPTNTIGLKWYEFETLRFYFCHWSLFTILLFSAIFKLYTPMFKNWWKMLCGFFIYETIICANTALLCFTNLVTREGYTQVQLFLSSKYMNNSFTFGPTQDMGFISDIFSALIPNFMKYDINGVTSCFPVLNLIVPAFLLIVPLYMLICLIFIKRQKENRE